MSTQARPAAEATLLSQPHDQQMAEAHPRTAASWLMIPREHGAWGLVSLPFLAGAVVAGGWANWPALAALLAVFSVFLLRAPLLALWRAAAASAHANGHSHAAEKHNRMEMETARISLCVYGSLAAGAGLYLLAYLPVVPLLLLGGGAALLTLALLYLSVHNYQRHPALQIASVIGLTASSLLAYMAAHGQLEGTAFWIWALSAAHGSASVLVVRARLESIVAARNSSPDASQRPHRRNALLAQAGILLLVAALAVSGQPWLILPFLPPLVLHGWELGHLRFRRGQRISLRRVGYLQLGASTVFCFLLIAILR